MAWLEVQDDPSRNDQSPITAVGGEAAGEPLHFERRDRGFVALFGVPLEGDDTVAVTLRPWEVTRATWVASPCRISGRESTTGSRVGERHETR